VADLRHELECRSLSSKGLKSQLIARLCKATKTEQEKEEEEAEKKVGRQHLTVHRSSRTCVFVFSPVLKLRNAVTVSVSLDSN